ncbi:MAG: redoxin domain-containing protein [Gemmatimonadaceae bacterium]|jgi:hypothetical protein|nr:redoxin domain-containing protein [Gemmatimonadaceae bacterium]
MLSLRRCFTLCFGLLLVARIAPAQSPAGPLPVRDRRPIAAFLALPATTLPPFSYPRLGGGAPVSSETVRGAPALVVFWSTFCPHGRSAIDAAVQVDAAVRGRGVRTIILAGNTAKELRAFEDSTRSGLAYGIAGDSALRAHFDQSATAPERDRYRIEWVLPGVVVLDRHGRVVARDFGTEGVLRQHALLDSLSRS